MSTIETFEQASYINHSLAQGNSTEIFPYPTTRDDSFLSVAGLYASLCASIKEKGLLHVYGDSGMVSFGSGGFSNAVRISETGVAKLPRILPDDDEFDGERFYRDLITELRIMLHPPIREHPNIINLEDVQWVSGPNRMLGIRWDYMWPTLEFETASGTLTGLLGSGPKLSFLEKIDLLFDVAKALDCLHDSGVVHSDIKPDNIFIFPHTHYRRKQIAKIADFGCSAILKQDQTHGRLPGGTKYWCAPEWREQLTSEELYKTDLYSFGLVVWYIISDGTAPFGWLDSWNESGPLSTDDILSLKEDSCLLLTLAHQSLLELSLSEVEMECALELLNHTLCEKESRSEYVSPYLEKYHRILTAGLEQSDTSHRIGNKEPLEPIPIVNIKSLMYKIHMDDRLRKQVFGSVKAAASSPEDLATSGSMSFQLFLCYYYGFGTERDMQACVSALVNACDHGNTGAQGFVAQFHLAHGVELPGHLEVFGWLAERVNRGGVGASKTLKSLDAEVYQETFSFVRYGVPNDPFGVTHEREILAVVESMVISNNPPSRSLLEDIERRTKYKTGHSLLHLAASAGMVTVIRGLLDQEVCDVNVISARSFGATPLWLACRAGHTEAALLLLSRLPAASNTLVLRAPTQHSIQALTKNRHCLHYLSAFNPKDILKVATQLVENIPDIINISLLNAHGRPEKPLSKAVFETNLEAVRALLALGARRTVDELYLAALLNAGDILELLLWDVADKGERISLEEMGQLFGVASSRSDAISNIELHGFETSHAIIRTFETLDYFAKLWHPEPWLGIQCSALELLIERRRLDTIQLVLDPIFKPCIKILSERYGHSVLLWPMRLGDMAMFSLFLEHGAADCVCMDVVFSKATQISNPFFVAELMRYGCMIDERTNLIAGGGPKSPEPNSGMCLFTGAVLNSCFDTATFLVKETGRIESEICPWDILIGAAVTLSQFGTLGKLDYLLSLKEGPRPVPPLGGQNALHRLSTWWCVEPEERRSSLRIYFGKVVGKLLHMMDVQDDDGETPIFQAAGYHNVLLVEALIETGASLNIKNNKGKTVLDMILAQRLMEVMRVNPDGPDPEPRDMTLRPANIKENTNRGWANSDGLRGINAGPADVYNAVYRGDAYDNRLDRIYSMIKAAGGMVTSPHGFNSRTEDLVAWSVFLSGCNREYPLLKRSKKEGPGFVFRVVEEIGLDSDVDEVTDPGISDT